MFRTFGISILLSVVFLAGCADPAEDKTKAVTKEPEAKNTETARQSKGESVPVTTDGSKIEFTGSKVTGKHDGGFKEFSGNIDLVKDDARIAQFAADAVPQVDRRWGRLRGGHLLLLLGSIGHGTGAIEDVCAGGLMGRRLAGHQQYKARYN